ncbi:MAG: cytochrome c oxidase accessory protein CcoG [Alphaproteobacteria bacterium]|nr:cytochrome c oxidase accessory protein CcoG [Alphaproteobacteria bacterium]
MTVIEKVNKSAEDYIIPGEAAPGVASVDVKPVNKREARELYAARQKIHPRHARGTFRRLKWLVMIATLGVYYLLPWIRWPRGEGLPNQAFLIDVANGRLFIGPIEIWPQELYFVTGLLIISALGLFLATSVAGRVWCGYTCPQTVWTDLMVAVERIWQGDRSARIRLDKAPWGPTKVFKKTMTHLSWALIGLFTGGALVFYFRDAPTLALELVTGTAPAIAYLFLGIFSATTYLLGGIAREQVCIYMCPWPRIQGAMTDRHTLLVSYRPERGEPRGPKRKSESWDDRGDCIDCNACVAVCPAGIDIRDGSQLECIQCALCIDACDEIMAKIDRPKGLIAYDTVARQDASARGEHEPFKLVRVRTMLYAGLIVLVSAIMVAAFATRSTIDVNVLRDRTAMFTRLSDGGLRNGYTLKILNKAHQPRSFTIGVSGLPQADVKVLGFEDEAQPQITVPTDDLRELRVFVAVPRGAVAKLTPPSTAFRFVIKDTADGRAIERETSFHSPAR